MRIRIDYNGYSSTQMVPQIEYIKDGNLWYIFFERNTGIANFNSVIEYQFDKYL